MPPFDSPLLVVRSLTCKRGECLLFEALDFSLLPGQVLQILGPNGIGKSSLLPILAGLLEPHSGNYTCATDLFYLGHQIGLKKVFTVEENLKFDLRYEKPSRERIQSLLNTVALSDCCNKKTDTLSQGQQQRLALAKCLLTKAKLWLLDEPFVAMDKTARNFWQNKITEHVQSGGGVLMCSHFPLKIPSELLRQVELSVC